jgi:hypothetical protein
MFATIIKAVIGGVAGPLVSLGEKYLDTQVDKDKLDAGVTIAAIEADAKFRASAMSWIEFRGPLFIVLAPHALYMSAIAIDSTFPSDYINPLELPDWYKPYFTQVTLVLLGITTGVGLWKRRKVS